MRRIDADTFELRLPVRGSANGLDLMQPKLVVRVTPSPETSSLLISSIRASLFGDAQALRIGLGLGLGLGPGLGPGLGLGLG